MHDINPKENFEPTHETKMWWRYTRKSPRKINSEITLPGLFQTHGFGLDALAFLIVLACEIFGLANLFQVGQMNPIYFVGLFLADVIFAVCRHIPQGDICELKNRRVNPHDANEEARIENKVSKWKFLSYPCIVFILLLATFKVISFYGLVGGFNGLVLAVLFSYALAAVLHIFCTGYFLFALFVSVLWKLSRGAFLANRGNNITHQRTYPFTSPFELRRDPNLGGSTLTIVAQHQLDQDNDDLPYRFMIDSKFQVELDNGQVSTGLRFEFQRNGHQLPEVVVVTIPTPGNHLITDTDQTLTYSVTKAAVGLNVSQKEFKYVLRTWGVLTDRQLQEFIMQQHASHQKRIVAREGIAAQLTILYLDPGA